MREDTYQISLKKEKQLYPNKWVMNNKRTFTQTKKNWYERSYRNKKGADKMFYF